MTTTRAELVQLYRSPGHNFVGHHGGQAGTHPMVAAEELRCVAGRGIEGDRFLDHKPDYRGQVTFFALETHLDLCACSGRADHEPSVYRRNVVTRGLDLNALIGTEFVVQGVRFVGTEECRPCHWMNEAFGPGAEAALKGRGGLRARILTDGRLRCGPI
jgi:MOSC domain-containing protein YiiM